MGRPALRLEFLTHFVTRPEEIPEAKSFDIPTNGAPKSDLSPGLRLKMFMGNVVIEEHCDDRWHVQDGTGDDGGALADPVGVRCPLGSALKHHVVRFLDVASVRG